MPGLTLGHSIGTAADPRLAAGLAVLADAFGLGSGLMTACFFTVVFAAAGRFLLAGAFFGSLDEPFFGALGPFFKALAAAAAAAAAAVACFFASFLALRESIADRV